ncbi:MAG: hypothetical protein EP330_02945 [Deltaproteobacteria bacterium]|nr:MAG: hypothetical protein EP330_02945 [Deltaproteobacteria bacterium]
MDDWPPQASPSATLFAMFVALFDLLLAVTCASAGVWLVRQPHAIVRYGALGMGLMALAAGLGSARYAGLDNLERLHRGASHLAGAVSPGCFALVAMLLVTRGKRWIAEVGIGALLLGWAVFQVLLRAEAYRTAIGAVAVLVMCGAALRDRSLAGATLAAGALGIAVAGLAIGTKGDLGPFQAINVFHVVLATSHLLVARGLAGLGRG